MTRNQRLVICLSLLAGCRQSRNGFGSCVKSTFDEAETDMHQNAACTETNMATQAACYYDCSDSCAGSTDPEANAYVDSILEDCRTDH